MLLKIFIFILKITVPYCEKNYKIKYGELFYLPLLLKIVPISLFIFISFCFLGQYIYFFKIISYICVSIFFIVSMTCFILLVPLDIYMNKKYNELFIEKYKLLKSEILKEKLVKKYKEKKINESVLIYLRNKNNVMFVTKKEYNENIKHINFLKRNNIDLVSNREPLMTDLETLIEIKKQKKDIILKEREVRSRIFANKEIDPFLEDEYGIKIIKKNDNDLKNNLESNYLDKLDIKIEQE